MGKFFPAGKPDNKNTFRSEKSTSIFVPVLI